MLALKMVQLPNKKGAVSLIPQGDPTTVLKVISVWRSLFFAIGTMLIIVGIEYTLGLVQITRSTYFSRYNTLYPSYYTEYIMFVTNINGESVTDDG